METHKQYKVVYKDNEYSKILHATLIEQDDFLLKFQNERDGVVIIGKASVIRIDEHKKGGSDDNQ